MRHFLNYFFMKFNPLPSHLLINKFSYFITNFNFILLYYFLFIITIIVDEELHSIILI